MTTAPQRYPEQETGDNQQIDVSDILQLVRTANEKGYIKTSDNFSKPKGEFKSRTLRDIAESNMKTIKEQAQSQPTKEAAPEPVTPDDRQEQTDPQANQEAMPSAEAAPQNAASAAEDASTSLPDQADANQETPPEVELEATSEIDQEASQEAAQDTPDADNLPDNNDPDNNNGISPEDNSEADGFKTTISPAQQAPVSAASEAEYERGFEAGKAAAHAEIDANLNAAMTSFIAAADAISREDSIDIAQLETAMFNAINQLASERAGIEIAINPAPFSAKVASMVSRIRNRIEDPVIHLHPEDITAIQPQLEAQLAPRQITLRADATMKRGDVRVDVGSIGVMDLLDDQPGQNPPKTGSKSNTAKAKHKADKMPENSPDNTTDDDSKNNTKTDVTDE
ncbi:MAG: hypothetical protein ISQ21_03405 [Alphaproteobacteria bacterium]|nr:hypothetical protein [Alphaproteobacteria bacterium]